MVNDEGVMRVMREGDEEVIWRCLLLSLSLIYLFLQYLFGKTYDDSYLWVHPSHLLPSLVLPSLPSPPLPLIFISSSASNVDSFLFSFFISDTMRQVPLCH